MKAQRNGKGLRERLDAGAAILAHAQVIDTSPVERRLQAFTTAHGKYVAAQTKVEAAEVELHTASAGVERCEQEVDAAVEALALALANDGHSRTKPFAALGVAAPSDLKNAATGDKVEVSRQLAAAAQVSRAAGRKTCEAARAIEEAAGKLEAALRAVVPLESALGELRRQRETLGLSWNRALGVLRRDARSAEDEGAIGLYAALFGAPAPAGRKTVQPAPPAASVPAPTPASVEPASSLASTS